MEIKSIVINIYIFCRCIVYKKILEFIYEYFAYILYHPKY